MLTARLDVQMRLGQIQVQPARLDLEIQSTPALQGSQIQISNSRFEISSAKASKIEVNARSIQAELGFKRPKELTEEGERRAKGEAQSAVSRITSEGDQYLNNPKSATTSIAKSVGVYKPTVQLAAIPKNRPRINVEKPEQVKVDFQKGRVDVTDNTNFNVDFNYSPAGAYLDRPPRIDIQIIPVSTPKLRIDFKI